MKSNGKKMIVAIAALVAAGVANRAMATVQQVGDVFYIALENHNFTQPTAFNASINPIYGDTAAAPYIQSLITPGTTNSAQVSYETQYYNAGTGEHPSEPNYVWEEAGTNYNAATGTTILGDGDPSAANGNIFPASAAANHLTGQLNAAGISWKNYQEDAQYSTAPTKSTSGTGGTAPSGLTVTTNPYNGTAQYNYAVKHNPMAFFADTATQNVEQMSQLAGDLASNSVGRYNWITPNQYNDMHSALSGGFTYNGQHFTGDQAMIAQGDNFLSIVIPQIEASAAYQNNGAIVIWNDETEGGDTTAETSTEIVISPLAKGNAYASSVATSHSSDVKTLEELYGLSFVNNAIPSSETFAGGGYANVPTSNDLSDLFVPGAITGIVPEPTSIAILAIGGVSLLARRRRA